MNELLQENSSLCRLQVEKQVIATADLTQRLGNWTDEDNREVSFDSSTGFKLPNGAKRSPDTSCVRLERWEALTPEQRRKFHPSLLILWWSYDLHPMTSTPCEQKWRNTQITACGWAGCSILKISRLKSTVRDSLWIYFSRPKAYWEKRCYLDSSLIFPAFSLNPCFKLRY